jgi:hypothetical protein
MSTCPSPPLGGSDFEDFQENKENFLARFGLWRSFAKNLYLYRPDREEFLGER